MKSARRVEDLMLLDPADSSEVSRKEVLDGGLEKHVKLPRQLTSDHPDTVGLDHAPLGNLPGLSLDNLPAWTGISIVLVTYHVGDI